MITITIKGPAGSGKSTAAELIERALDESGWFRNANIEPPEKRRNPYRIKEVREE